MKRFSSELGDLANPDHYTQHLDLLDFQKDDLVLFLESMLAIRIIEEQVAYLIETDLAKCPCHLGIGQEAIAVGVGHTLRHTDRVFGTHRSHSHYLALGGGIEALFAEILGKNTGCSRGMGGSMHLYAKDKGFYGAVPIVGGTVPIAVGAGLAAQMDRRGDIAVSYFGDGTIEEGVVQEALNLASVMMLPVLFVCENNLFASHLDIHYRQPSDRVARFADAHHIPARVVDGNDVLAVARAARELTDVSRQGGGPGFIEAITYRWRGHVGSDEDIDVGLRRKAKDLVAWKKRDPIRRLVDAMIERKWIAQQDYNSLVETIRTRVLQASKKAQDAPYPDPSALMNFVYSQKS